MMTTTGYTVVYTATWEWLEVVQRAGELLAEPLESWPDGWEDLAVQSLVEPEDPGLGFSAVTHAAPRHEAIRPGDLMVSQGFGGDVCFLREAR